MGYDSGLMKRWLEFKGFSVSNYMVWTCDLSLPLQVCASVPKIRCCSCGPYSRNSLPSEYSNRPVGAGDGPFGARVCVRDESQAIPIMTAEPLLARFLGPHSQTEHPLLCLPDPTSWLNESRG